MPLHRFESWEEFMNKLFAGEIPGGVLCDVQIVDGRGNILASGADVPLAQIGDDLRFLVAESSGLGGHASMRSATFPVTRDGMATRMMVDGLPMALPQKSPPFMLRKGDSFTLHG